MKLTLSDLVAAAQHALDAHGDLPVLVLGPDGLDLDVYGADTELAERRAGISFAAFVIRGEA